MPPLLTVLVPVFNEERTLRPLMETLSTACADAQIIYVDDGSQDRSLEILQQHRRPQDLVITKANGGKGSAIRCGLACAKGKYTVIQDADLEYDPAQIPSLLRAAEVMEGSAIFGSRFLRQNPNLYRRYLIGNKVLTATLNLLFGARLTDSYTCYKLLPTKAWRALDLWATGFEVEAEICAQCLRRRIAIQEVPISYRPRTIEEGKKISWRDAWRGLATMVRIRLSR